MPDRQKLTEAVLRNAVPTEGRDYQIFDTELRGFAVCIYRGGGRAFTYRRRAPAPRHCAGRSMPGVILWQTVMRSARRPESPI
jgi:hypothetical protein